MMDFQHIENECCNTNCDAYAHGICPYFGKNDKLNRCERIKKHIENGQN